MWFLVFLSTFFQSAPAVPAEPQTPSLVVQTVDEAWIPIVGVEVKLSGAKGQAPVVIRTDESGYAKFYDRPSGEREISAAKDGFKSTVLTRFKVPVVNPTQATAYVQFRLKVNLKNATTVY